MLRNCKAVFCKRSSGRATKVGALKRRVGAAPISVKRTGINTVCRGYRTSVSDTENMPGKENVHCHEVLDIQILKADTCHFKYHFS